MRWHTEGLQGGWDSEVWDEGVNRNPRENRGGGWVWERGGPTRGEWILLSKEEQE